MPSPPPQTKQIRALRALLAHAIDYAGLYPPAALSLTQAAREYAEQRRGAHAWALGRFVLGADQLRPLVQLRGEFGGDAWPLSVLFTGQSADLAIFEQHAGVIRLDAMETKAASVADIQSFAPIVEQVPELYVELPSNAELSVLLNAIHALGARAKIRMGGVTADAIPSAAAVARFLKACAEHGVRFKATAGLHHLIRGEYPLTYAPGSARATMFGFLNVFVAAALALRGASAATLTLVLDERDISAFQYSDAGETLCWRDECLTLQQLRSARNHGIAGFGSCSFAEPVAELTAAGFGVRL